MRGPDPVSGDLRRLHQRLRQLGRCQDFGADNLERPPDLHVKLHDLATGPDFAIARGTVSGTALGRLYGAPATKHHYEASYFDYVQLDQGRIVERVQQADVLGQMRQLYGRVLGVAGISAMLLRQHPPDDPTQSA